MLHELSSSVWCECKSDLTSFFAVGDSTCCGASPKLRVFLFCWQIFIFESFCSMADLSNGHKSMMFKLFHPNLVCTYSNINYRSDYVMKPP